MNIYELEVRAICPIHKNLIDIYQVTVETTAVIEVSILVKHFNKYEKKQIYQERLTQESAIALGARVKTVGIHSGVKVTSTAP